MILKLWVSNAEMKASATQFEPPSFHKPDYALGSGSFVQVNTPLLGFNLKQITFLLRKLTYLFQLEFLPDATGCV